MSRSSPHEGSGNLGFLSRTTARTLDKLASGWRELGSAIPRFLYSFYVDENRDYGACVLLAGGGRGGTTWVADIINYDNSYRFMFEPFYGARVKQSRAFGECQYLRPDNVDPMYVVPAQDIFSGRLRGGWVDAYNRVLRVDRRLVKDIRVNLLLGWIRAHFPAIPIILLMRHPCAVAYSRSKEQWTSDLESNFLGQADLMEDFLKPFRSAFLKARGDFERHIFSWCVENYVPLTQFSPGDIMVTTYEDLVISPKVEVKRLFDFLGKPYCDDALAYVGKPSSQSRWNRFSQNASAIVSGESIVEAWRRYVSPNDVRRAVEILELFGLDGIYDADPLPKTPFIEKFMMDKKATRHASLIHNRE
jgi:hypothetical protein